MTRSGRRIKLSKKLIAQIVDAIQVGATYEIAATYAGVHRRTFHVWMEKARKLQDELEKNPEHPLDDKDILYLELLDKVTEANASAAIDWLSVIYNQAKIDAQWAAWMLGRRFPTDYGNIQKQEVQQSGTLRIELVEEALVPKKDDVDGNGSDDTDSPGDPAEAASEAS